MPTETLVCAFDGHSWSREITRGKKPRLCPQHRPEAPERASQTTSGTKVPAKALAILCGEEGRVLPELRNKLEYCCAEVDSPRRSTGDVNYLLNVIRELIAEHRRRRA